MTITEFTLHLRQNPDAALRFLLPDGGLIPAHAHITEVGRVEKCFMDCGGTVRQVNTCLLQTWVADDTDHRLVPGKLADILERAKHILKGEDLPVEIEFEDFVISQFPVVGAEAADGTLTFALVTKHTDCLAKELCLPKTGCCTPGGGCC
ncbi:MAG: DUF6428 family protein [Roseimicrobium sp.]